MMAIEQKNTTSSSTVVVSMGYLLRDNAQTVEPMSCGDRVCAVS
jgi:hypothetical protein